LHGFSPLVEALRTSGVGIACFSALPLGGMRQFPPRVR
jgi:hypothetical protein